MLYFKAIPKLLTTQNHLILLLFFTLAASFVPLLGTFMLGVFAIALNWFYRETEGDIAHSIEMPRFIREKTFQPKFIIDERKIRETLTSKHQNITEKINALMAINLEASSQANLINRALLSKTSDEVRLLAFSLLAKQENEINEQINYLLNALKTIPNKIDDSKVYKHLALLYWNLIDLNLVQKDLLDFTIDKSLMYAHKALEKLQEDNTLWVLIGRAYILKNDVTKAYDALNRATRLHASDRKILPYLAELSFKNKNYEEMKSYLFMDDCLRNNPALFPIINFWKKTWAI